MVSESRKFLLVSFLAALSLALAKSSMLYDFYDVANWRWDIIYGWIGAIFGVSMMITDAVLSKGASTGAAPLFFMCFALWPIIIAGMIAYFYLSYEKDKITKNETIPV